MSFGFALVFIAVIVLVFCVFAAWFEHEKKWARGPRTRDEYERERRVRR